MTLSEDAVRKTPDATVWFGLGIIKSTHTVLVLYVSPDHNRARERTAKFGSDAGCDATTVLPLEKASHFATMLRLWLFDVAGIVGADATDIIRGFCAKTRKMLTERDANK